MILLGPDFQLWTPTPVARNTGERRFAAVERRQASRDSDALGRPVIPPVSPPPPVTSVQPAPLMTAAAAMPRPAAGLATANEQASLKLVGRNAARAAERELMLKMLNRHALESERSRRDSRNQLQGLALQNQRAPPGRSADRSGAACARISTSKFTPASPPSDAAPLRGLRERGR